LGFQTGYGDFDRRDMTGEIKVPVLLVIGKADWFACQDQVEATRDRIPRGRVAVLDGTEHYPMTKHPQEFNDAARGFLAQAGA
jgi:pimeloyl-ACP methyl ester carboxylesterase